ncbi:MAG: hypothetical protein A3F43_04105 [Gammaproteobacteria bacterium RIFCSPHIGHO2_12_FULL_42_10]|nr:MAG: hypothetical protein A3F43_04105 [Gammaproteobacteria bacterium RIFCSPHIGHO2_12_FULL_42_10]
MFARDKQGNFEMSANFAKIGLLGSISLVALRHVITDTPPEMLADLACILFVTAGSAVVGTLAGMLLHELDEDRSSCNTCRM